MKQLWGKTAFLLALLALVLAFSACSKDTGSSAPTNTNTNADVEHGELVPQIRIFSSLRDSNEINYLASVDVQKVWEDLGISVSLEPQEFNTLVNIIYGDDQDFDAYTIGWGGRVDRIDPDMFIYSIFHSSNAIPGGNNTTGFMNEAYDRLAEAQREEMDPAQRQKLVYEAQEMLAEEAPLLTLYARALNHAYNKERFDNMVIMAGEGMFNEWTPMRATPLTDDKWLKIGSIYDLDTVNPLGANSTYEWRNLRLLYDKLVRLSPQAEPQPAAAESWEVLDDTTIEVKVREGMRFHDGEPVTAEDVKFSYDYYIEWEFGYFMAFLEAIDSIEVLDEYTLQFHLKRPYAPFVGVTMAQIPILPKHIWENVVAEKGLSHPDEYANEAVIGSGPFQIDHWRRGQELRASKNPYFYDEIAIDGYIYDIYAQHEGVMTALETKDIDMNAEEFIPAHIDRAHEIGHLEVLTAGDIGYQYLSFNMRKPPFDDLAFRQAIAHTVDYDTIIDVYQQGHGVKGGAGLVISPYNEFWHNPDVVRPEYDPEKARQILENAGYTWDAQGKLRFPVK